MSETLWTRRAEVHPIQLQQVRCCHNYSDGNRWLLHFYNRSIRAEAALREQKKDAAKRLPEAYQDDRGGFMFGVLSGARFKPGKQPPTPVDL